MKPDLKILRPDTVAEKRTGTTTDTIEVTPEILNSWQLPPFQRPLRVNTKVLALADKIKEDGGVIPGTLTVGTFQKIRYLVDGQHRREAFLLSGCEVGYVDVRFGFYESMSDMAQEFFEVNSRLVAMKPDDMLRALESGSPYLQRVRKRCPFVGYDMIRRNEKSPVISMSAALRCWAASGADVPAAGGISAIVIVDKLDAAETDALINFLDVAYRAWRSDSAYHRLWLNLNLTLCMWLFRGMVTGQYSVRTQKISEEQFGRGLLALSAETGYLDYLQSRQLNERDRSPAYNRLKTIFGRRLEQDLGKKVLMPSPPWAAHSGVKK